MDNGSEGEKKGEAHLMRVKTEKVDPEIEKKLVEVAHKSQSSGVVKVKQEKSCSKNAVNGKEKQDINEEARIGDDEESNENICGGASEDKKSVEAVKSSNEILTELFNVFNASIPEELLDDASLLKKCHKHKKRKKEKKKKHKGELSEGERTESDSSNSLASKDRKNKHKKKRKHKHRDDNDREKSKDKDKTKERRKSKDRESKKTPVSSVSKGSKKDYAEEKQKQEDGNKRKRHSTTAADDIPTKTTRSEAVINNNERDKERDRDKDKDKIKDCKANTFYNGFRERSDFESTRRIEIKIKKEPSISVQRKGQESERGKDKDKDKDKDKGKDGYISEISLSDEETYLREHENSEDINRRGRCKREPRSHSRTRNSFYSGIERTRSRYGHGGSSAMGSKRYRRSRSKTHSRTRSRSRSRTRSRSRDLGIDKKRLLEIARKNAISMFKRGNLPGCAGMSEEIKDKVLLKMRYGGRTVQDLTEFCKKISNGEDLSDLSSDEDSDQDKNGNAKAFHHPFTLKEREPIVMHIRNATSIPPRKSEDQKKAITMQFPVSSGQQHRMSEVWVPVEIKDSLPPLPALPAATQSTTIFKGATVPKNVFEKAMPAQEQQEPAFKSMVPMVPPPTVVGSVANPAQVETLTDNTTNPPAIVPPPVSIPPLVPIDTTVPPPPFVPDVPIPSAAPPPLPKSIFPHMSGQQFDVSSIISKRLNAMRRLQENPTDPEAIKMMYNSQKEMSSWASSKYLPGQFTGSTGVNVLKPSELNSGPQAWARRDQLTSTQPMTGGMGMQLLQKMGWKPGEGLGREKTGSLQPLLLDVKLDKRGLVSKEDHNNKQRQLNMKKRGVTNTAQAQNKIQDKHPVCLLNEMTSKRKWTPPLYTLVNETGPSHSKMFLFSVCINGQTYTPDKACNTKKEAKMLAARNCLQQIGILPMQ